MIAFFILLAASLIVFIVGMVVGQLSVWHWVRKQLKKKGNIPKAMSTSDLLLRVLADVESIEFDIKDVGNK